MVGRQTRASLARLAAVAIWADEKLEPEEIESAREMARALGMAWGGFHKALMAEIEALMSDLDREGESITDVIGQIYLEDGVDPLEVLGCLVRIVVSDNRVTLRELEVVHGVADVLRIPPILVTQAIVSEVAPVVSGVPQREN